MAKGYFDIKRDIEIEKAGGFFCEACLVGRPLDDQSPDPRYCLGCFDFLLKEVETDSRQGKRTWYPRQGEDTPPNASKNHQEGAFTPGHNFANGSLGAVGVGIMSRPKKRGPRRRVLPREMVTKLSSEGASSRAIAVRLRAEGITVSSKTIQRLLAGQRALVVL